MMMAARDSRRVLDYSDISTETSISAHPQNAKKSGAKQNKQNTSSSSNPSSSKPVAWSPDGTPQTASSARKLRKILNLLSLGQIGDAEKELSTMEMAKNNFEIQRALVIAKKKRAEGVSQDAAEKEGENGNDLECDEESCMELGDTTFDWQGSMEESGVEGGRQLTHAEIWDDSALVDAWKAAEEEYVLFHAQRSLHESSRKRHSELSEAEQLPRKKSALWHESPEKGSPAAIAAKAALEDEGRKIKELEDRKRQAKALLARVAGDKQQAKLDDVEIQASTPMTAAPSGPETDKSKLKRFKGTTPPSSALSGNLAWHSACATVSRTPNAIGRTAEEATQAPKLDLSNSASVNEAALPTSSEGEEIFQNLAMAWYYAGYYQAMASSWSAAREAGSK
jgi:hypothetical protein